jgi:hypothetical protein
MSRAKAAKPVASSWAFESSWVLAGATIFFGAFFLFQVEPLIAKAIIPWFGGSAQVWTTCLLFFQVGLLCGYLYAHLLSEHVPPVWQCGPYRLLVLSPQPADFPGVWKPKAPETR